MSGPAPELAAVAALRAGLWQCGFRPVPLYGADHQDKARAGKAPLGNNWGDLARRDPPDCLNYPPVWHAPNTGILCDGLRAIDFDIDDAAVVARAMGVILGAFAPARVRFRANSPRILVLYRARSGEPSKLTLAGTRGKIEILGRGQQFAAFGRHPPGADLGWRPMPPGTIARDSLPDVSEEELHAVLAELAPLIGAPPPTARKPRPQHVPDEQGASDSEPDLEQLTTARRLIPNEGPADWEHWNNVGMAVFAATAGSDAGLALWREWSARHPNHDAAETEARWAHYFASPPSQTGAQKLYAMAEAALVAKAAKAPKGVPSWAGGNGQHPPPPPPPGDASAADDDGLDPPPTMRPVIAVKSGARHEAADAGLAALAMAGVPFDQRGGVLVRVARAKTKAANGTDLLIPAVTPVTAAMLGRALGAAARWEKYNAGGTTRLIDPPAEVVEQIAAMTDAWPFPPLRGLIDTPTLRPDGSLLDKPGYDAASGYVLFNPPPMQPLPEQPTQRDALEALSDLNKLLAEFPFVDDAARSVAMSMLLTPVLRAAMPVVPMHVVSAPEGGTGKSYLADIASVIATGERCAVLAVSDAAEETEKRLVGAALAQTPIIALDNVNGLLMGDFLGQATERHLLQIRPLGTWTQLRIANTFTVFANGNNLTIGADAVRRCVQSRLDAGMETPEARVFAANPVRTVLADRGRYVHASLIVARAYLHAGQPGRLPGHPSYEAWSDLARSALVWLGWPDPVETVASIRADDPVRQQRRDVFTAWAGELVSGVGYTTAEIVDAAEAWAGNTRARPALFAALLAVARARSAGEQVERRRLGLWLRRNQDTVSDGWKLTADRSDPQRPRWRLAGLRP